MKQRAEPVEFVLFAVYVVFGSFAASVDFGVPVVDAEIDISVGNADNFAVFDSLVAVAGLGSPAAGNSAASVDFDSPVVVGISVVVGFVALDNPVGNADFGIPAVVVADISVVVSFVALDNPVGNADFGMPAVVGSAVGVGFGISAVGDSAASVDFDNSAAVGNFVVKVDPDTPVVVVVHFVADCDFERNGYGRWDCNFFGCSY